MWPFHTKPPHRVTQFYDPTVEEIRDPALREHVSRLNGRCDQLAREQAYFTNLVNELRERLMWTTQREGSPFTEGDRVAREIATAATQGSLKLEPPGTPGVA